MPNFLRSVWERIFKPSAKPLPEAPAEVGATPLEEAAGVGEGVGRTQAGESLQGEVVPEVESARHDATDSTLPGEGVAVTPRSPSSQPGEVTLNDLLTSLVKVLNDFQKDGEQPRPKRFESLSAHFTTARTITVSGVVVLLTVLLFGVVVYETLKEESVQIEPFKVPEALEKKGYTSYAFANMLAGQLNEISKEASNWGLTERKGKGFSVAASSYESSLDIEVPQANVSLKSLIQYVKGLIRRPTRLDGEIIIIREQPKKPLELGVNVRVFDGQTGEITLLKRRITEEELEPTFKTLSEDVCRLIEPLQLAMYLHRTDSGRLNDAIKDARLTIQNKTADDDYWGYIFLGYLSVSKNEGDCVTRYTDDALYYAGKAIEINRDLAEAYHLLGNIHYQRDNFEEAKNNYFKALSLNATFLGTYNNLGEIYIADGDYRAAEYYLKKGMALDRTWDALHVNLGWVFYRMNQPGKAVDKFKDALDLNEYSTYALMAWGKFLQEKGDLAAAREKYLAALNASYSDVVCEYRKFADELDADGAKHESALAYADWGDVRMNWGRWSKENQKAEDARSQFSEALSYYQIASARSAQADLKERIRAAKKEIAALGRRRARVPTRKRGRAR